MVIIKSMNHCFKSIVKPREQNYHVDILSKLASMKKVGQHQTLIQET